MNPVRPESDLFCIKCGGPDPVADGECERCLEKDITVIKGPGKRVRVEQCRHCGATPRAASWRAPASTRRLIEEAAIAAVEVPEQLVVSEMGVALEEQGPDAYRVRIDVDGTYKGVELHGETTVEVRIRGATCPACSRRHGGYFEAIVQVRREGRHDVSDEEAGDIALLIEQEVTRTGGLAGGQSYLLKVEARHGGYDYFFGTYTVAQAVTTRLKERYGASVNHTRTIHGQRDGRTIYRHTLAVRIPEATPGSILGLDGEVLVVVSRKGNRMLTRKVPSGDKRNLDERELERAVVLDVDVVDVVYADAGEGQILTPDEYKPVQVRMPLGIRSNDQVRAVRYEGQWVVLGPVEDVDHGSERPGPT